MSGYVGDGQVDSVRAGFGLELGDGGSDGLAAPVFDAQADGGDLVGVGGVVGREDLGVVFIVKMILFSAMLVAVGLHTFLVGPKLVNALDKQGQGGSVSDKSVRRLRLQSMSLSITGLVLVIAIMVMGVMLNTAQWSLG